MTSKEATAYICVSLLCSGCFGQTKIDYPTQIKNGPAVIDTTYTTLLEGCNVAATYHAIFNVTKQWNNVPSTACNAVVNFVGSSARIEPASAAVFSAIGYTAPSRQAVWLVDTTGVVRITGSGTGSPIYAGNFSTFAAACDTAAVAVSTLQVNTPIDTSKLAVSTACAASLYAGADGLLQPSSGTTLTLSGSFDGVLTQHFDITAGGMFASAPGFSMKAMYWQYWGIVSSTSLDQTVAMQAAIDGSTNMGVHTMTFTPDGNTYAFTHLQLPSDTKLDCGPGLPGADSNVKATLKGLSATSMIGYGMQAVTNVNHATVTWVSGDKFDKTVLTSAGNSIIFAGIPNFHVYTIVSVDSPTQLTIDIGSHDPGVFLNQLTNMRVDGNAVIGCQINGNNVATAGIIMYDGGVFPQATDNYITGIPFGSSNAAFKGGAVLYMDLTHNGVSTAARAIDIIDTYSSSASSQPCGFCNITRNDFFSAGVRYSGLAINFELNDLEGESLEAPWANIDLSHGDCEACSVTGSYTEDPCETIMGVPVDHVCRWIYGTVAGPIFISHNTVFGNNHGRGNKTLAFNIIGQANGIRDNYVTGWDYDFGIVAANNNNIYLDESNTLSYDVAQIEYSTAGGFIPPYQEDGSVSVNTNQMHLVDDKNGLIGRMPNGLTCIFPNVVMRLGCGNIFRLDQAGTFTGATYPNTTTPRTGEFFMYSSVGSILATHGGVNTTGLFNFSAQHSFTLPNHYPLNMMVETTGTISEVKSSQDIPTTYAVMNAVTCNATNEGVHFPITDSNTSTFGATIASSGAFHGLAWCDGTNWTFR